MRNRWMDGINRVHEREGILEEEEIASRMVLFIWILAADMKGRKVGLYDEATVISLSHNPKAVFSAC